VAEVSHHRERFLARTGEFAIDMRCFRVEIRAPLDDVRGDLAPAGVMAPHDYGASQICARRRRDTGSMGIVYHSVRRLGGQCVAFFNPLAMVPRAQQTEHITLCWNGERIDHWYRKSYERRVLHDSGNDGKPYRAKLTHCTRWQWSSRIRNTPPAESPRYGMFSRPLLSDST